MTQGRSTKELFELNREGWDQRARAHFNSDFYDVQGFLKGQSSLREIELAELGRLEGKSLLHLQCHFGLDTLSLARMGARTTGVDLSPVAIEQARALAKETGIDARFVRANVYDFDRGDDEPYDLVFTSYGTICWLPDLSRWANVVSSNLVAGGAFYMVEFHPIYDLLDGYSYFNRSEPDVEEEGTYTENGEDVVAEFAVWSHPISNVVNALIDAGIQVTGLREYPFSPYNCFDGLEEREPGRFYLEHNGNDVPLVYSLMGRKS